MTGCPGSTNVAFLSSADVPETSPYCIHPGRFSRLRSMTSLTSRSDLMRKAVMPLIPVPLTTFVGRERETRLALDLLHGPDVRLLTLTGPGGIGKTRLALEICRETEEFFAEGVYFVQLAAVRDANLVLSTVIRTLGVQSVDGVSDLELLVRSLRNAHALLVLDNFEQVVDASPVLSELLGACPKLKIMVTSRSLLRIAGEQTLTVPPLAIEGPESGQSIDALVHSPAVQLFTQRAQAVSPGFDIDKNNVATVADVCRLLDGLPLAIEIAAAQSVVLPPDALLVRIRSQLPLPVEGLRDAPARHRTMRDAVAWSYALLSDEERTLFRRAGIFLDGFSVEAVEYVYAELEGSIAGGPNEARRRDRRVAILGGLTSFVEKSLVRQEAGEGEPRFNMLETVRAFALEEMASAGELDLVSDAHATWFLNFATLRERAPLLPGGEEQLLQIETEHANLRAALAWFAHRRGP